jgi:hypothetical protein
MSYNRWKTHFFLYEMFDYYSRINHHRVMMEHYFGKADGALGKASRDMRDLMRSIADKHFAWSRNLVQIPQWSKSISEDWDNNRWNFTTGYEDTDKRPIVRKVSQEGFANEIQESYLSASGFYHSGTIQFLLAQTMDESKEKLDEGQPQ